MDPSLPWSISVAGWIHLLPGPFQLLDGLILYLAYFSCWMDPSLPWSISVAGWIYLLPGLFQLLDGSIFSLVHFSCWMDPSFPWPISVAGWIHLLPGPDLGCLPLPQCVVKDDTRLEVISAQQTSTAGADSKDPPCPPPSFTSTRIKCLLYIYSTPVVRSAWTQWKTGVHCP